MRILILDTASNCLDLAMRCQIAGHTVIWWDKPQGNGEPRRAGEGLVPKVKDFNEVRRKWIDAADLIYTPDNVQYIDLLEPYRQRGYPIFNANAAAAKLEVDREAGQAAMRKAGLRTLQSKSFHDYQDAIRYVEKENRAFVSKPSGDADKALTYVANNAADLVFMLERWNKNPEYRKMAKKDGFILQEKIDGMEMAVGGYFGPHGWNEVFFENFEYKKLCVGDLGVNTGEMGTACRPVRKSKLAEMALIPFTRQLHEMGYVGFVDNAVMIEKTTGGICPMELTISRDGWPIRHNIQSLLAPDLDPAQWMLDLVNGVDSMRVRKNVCSVSVVMPLPPFPYQHVVGKDVDGIPLYNATDMSHVHLSEARLEADVPVMADGKVERRPNLVATDVYPLVVTGTGETITGARKSAYSAVKKIKIPNSPFYRTDIGNGRLIAQLPALQKFGFAKDWKYA